MNPLAIIGALGRSGFSFLNPSSTAGPSLSSAQGGTQSGSLVQNILSPGSNAGASAGVSGMFLWVIVGLIGVVLLVRNL